MRIRDLTKHWASLTPAGPFHSSHGLFARERSQLQTVGIKDGWCLGVSTVLTVRYWSILSVWIASCITLLIQQWWDTPRNNSQAVNLHSSSHVPSHRETEEENRHPLPFHFFSHVDDSAWHYVANLSISTHFPYLHSKVCGGCDLQGQCKFLEKHLVEDPA